MNSDSQLLKKITNGRQPTEVDLVHAAILAYLHDISKKAYIKEHKDDEDLQEIEATEPGKLVNLIPYLNDLKYDDKNAINICRIKVKLRRLKSTVLSKHLERVYELIYQDQVEFWGNNGTLDDSDLDGTDPSTLVNVPPSNQMNKGIVSLWKVPATSTPTEDPEVEGDIPKKNGKKRERSSKDLKEPNSKRQKGKFVCCLIILYFL